MKREPMYLNSVSEIDYTSTEEGNEIILHITDDMIGIVDITITRPFILTPDDPNRTIQDFLKETITDDVDVVRVVPDNEGTQWRIDFCKGTQVNIIKCDIDC